MISAKHGHLPRRQRISAWSINSWHLGYEKRSLPHNQGFDDFYGILNTADETLYVPTMELSKAAESPTRASHKFIGAWVEASLKRLSPVGVPLRHRSLRRRRVDQRQSSSALPSASG